jgi:hypothetical protein
MCDRLSKLHLVNGDGLALRQNAEQLCNEESTGHELRGGGQATCIHYEFWSHSFLRNVHDRTIQVGR